MCNEDMSLIGDSLKELKTVADVSHFPAKEDVLFENINFFDAYFASAEIQMNKRIIDKAVNLKVIATASTGTDHIDVVYARKKNIDVIHIAKDLDLLNGFTATAEQAWGLLLSCIRKLPVVFDCAKNGFWARQRFLGFQLSGKTLGIIGLGRLGKMMVKIGNGFGMNVIGYDVLNIDFPGVQKVTLDELLKLSDVITIHIHLTNENIGFISDELFKKMKKGVVLINTSRGAIIDEDALVQNLQSGHVSAAGLDVIHGEWDTDIYDHPLIKYSRENNNLVITPHIGGATIESIVGARVFVTNKLAEYIKQMDNIR